MQVEHEPYGPNFDKYHLNPIDKSPEFPAGCRPVIHRIGVDLGAPHDHPWDFTTFCLYGGYEEEWFYVEEGVWKMQRLVLLPGEARRVPSNHVHRISRLLADTCLTCVLYETIEQTRQWRYHPEALA